jgi:hypothetical protein
MSDVEDQEAVRVAALAEALGVAIRPEHLAEAARGWRLLAPHRLTVAQADLSPAAEPAPVFRP